jgi:hypothetical protein
MSSLPRPISRSALPAVRLTLPGSPAERLVLLAALAVSAVVGAMASYAAPKPVLAATVGGVAVVAVLARYGATGAAGLLLAAAALVPSVRDVQFHAATVGGHQATTIRMVLMVGLLALGVLLLWQRYVAGTTRTASALIGALLALALLGVGVPFGAPYANPAGVADSITHTAGQPLVYALAFGLFASVARWDPEARRRLLVAWCLVVLAEAAIVALQFARHETYDVIRHYRRAFGTMQSDSLGAFMLIGAFAGMALRAAARSANERLLGTATVGVALVVMIAAIARASVIGFAVAILALLVMNPGYRVKALTAAGVTVVLLVAFHGLWSARLNASATQTFDRPATWVAGIRMTVDHPLTGVGSTNDQFLAAIAANNRYRDTTYGVTASVPHNSWIATFAGNGIPYGLLFCLVSWRFAVTLRRRRRAPGDRYLLAGVIGTGVVYAVVAMFPHPENTMFMLAAAALLAGAPPVSQRRSASAA